jgi:hypothetical protein
MLNGNGWATSSEIAAASLLLDLQIDVWLHQRNVYSKIHLLNEKNQFPSPGTGKTLNLVSFIEMLEDGKVGARIATDL